MSNEVEFSEEKYVAPRATPPPSFITALMMKWGLAKSEKDAQLILLFIAAICVLVSAVVVVQNLSTDAPPVPQAMIEAGLPENLRR